MHRTIIADTSVLILLNKIGELELLKKLYGKILITEDIADEYENELPLWFEIGIVKDIQKQNLLELQIDKGEASAIALALESENPTVILDDWKARKIAELIGLNITGTLGMILKSKEKGIIPKVKPLLDKIKLTNFRISQELENEILVQANEVSK
jgi:predicted nucleic acid-binding protein